MAARQDGREVWSTSTPTGGYEIRYVPNRKHLFRSSYPNEPYILFHTGCVIGAEKTIEAAKRTMKSRVLGDIEDGIRDTLNTLLELRNAKVSYEQMKTTRTGR